MENSATPRSVYPTSPERRAWPALSWHIPGQGKNVVSLTGHVFTFTRFRTLGAFFCLTGFAFGCSSARSVSLSFCVSVLPSAFEASGLGV